MTLSETVSVLLAVYRVCPPNELRQRRLVLADALEEAGDERYKLVRRFESHRYVSLTVSGWYLEVMPERQVLFLSQEEAEIEIRLRILYGEEGIDRLVGPIPLRKAYEYWWQEDAIKKAIAEADSFGTSEQWRDVVEMARAMMQQQLDEQMVKAPRPFLITKPI